MLFFSTLFQIRRIPTLLGTRQTVRLLTIMLSRNRCNIPNPQREEAVTKTGKETVLWKEKPGRTPILGFAAF